MIPVTWRPIDTWPGPRTPESHRPWTPFKRRAGDGWRREDVPLVDTLTDLQRELRALDAKNVVIMLDLPESAFRLDGQPRADARAPGHPGVILAFDSRHGPLKYATDLFRTWQANLRAITLALEALRKVDRCGITRRGEQYTGWRALPGGSIAVAATMTRDEAAELLVRLAEVDAGERDVAIATVLRDPGEAKRLYLAAAKIAHPDNGGTTDAFQRLQQAWRILGGQT